MSVVLLPILIFCERCRTIARFRADLWPACRAVQVVEHAAKPRQYVLAPVVGYRVHNEREHGKVFQEPIRRNRDTEVDEGGHMRPLAMGRRAEPEAPPFDEAGDARMRARDHAAMIRMKQPTIVTDEDDRPLS